ncbi:MAG TPA: hypothetical protein VGD74_10325, partial [Vulgatibacter sp.]
PSVLGTRRVVVGALEIDLFKNAPRPKQKQKSEHEAANDDPLDYPTVLSIVPTPGASEENFGRDLAWLINRFRNPPERKAVAICDYPAPLPERQLQLVLDASVPGRLVFTHRGIDDPRLFLDWAEIRRELFVFAYVDRPAAFFEPTGLDSLSSRIRRDWMDELGGTGTVVTIDEEYFNWFLAKKRRVLVKDQVTWVPRCTRELLLETAEESSFVTKGDIFVASLEPGDVSGAREMMRAVTLSEWMDDALPEVDGEAIVCSPGGNYLIWTKPGRSTEDVARFVHELADRHGWNIAVDEPPALQ